MKKYNITVNGTAYAVEVEEVGGTTVTAAPAAAPSAGAAAIESPMPGTILDIKVKAGDAVKAGDVLLILEAMKMENEIIAPSTGTVDTVQVSRGASVNAGDILLSIK